MSRNVKGHMRAAKSTVPFRKRHCAKESAVCSYLLRSLSPFQSKCARYWPYLQKTVNYGPFEVYCLSEEEVTAHSATCRHFVLRHHTVSPDVGLRECRASIPYLSLLSHCNGLQCWHECKWGVPL